MVSLLLGVAVVAGILTGGAGAPLVLSAAGAVSVVGGAITHSIGPEMAILRLKTHLGVFPRT